MSLYDNIVAAGYDRFVRETERAGTRERRARLLDGARGRTLEIGAGTGLNAAHYPRDLERLVLTEPSRAMVSKLRSRVASEGLEAEVVVAPAADLPFPDESFDTVVATLVLCTVPDLPAALAEIHRVLAPGGNLLLIEHVRSDDPGRARWQDRLERPWRVFGAGCRCNRDTEHAVEAAGFVFDELEHGKMRKAPPIVRPLIQGRAHLVTSAR
jgi:ubiquinone/menaquinone biosynthesis C-methylase UbiE